MSKPQCQCKFKEHMESPAHHGMITEEEASGLKCKLVISDYHSKCCGNAMRMYWAVNEAGVVKDARYQMFGCRRLGVLADVLVGLCIGKTVDDCMKITNLDIEKELVTEPHMPPEKIFSTLFFYNIISRAVALYKGKKLVDIESEELVCTCGEISLNTIKEAIKQNDLKTVEEITKCTQAGSYCKSCPRAGGKHPRKYYLEDILRETRAEMECAQCCKEKCCCFDKMTLYHKVMRINEVFSEKIACQCKEQKVEIYEVKEGVDDEVAVLIQIEGNCCGCCPEGLKKRDCIQTTLRETLSHKIDVIVVPHCNSVVN